MTDSVSTPRSIPDLGPHAHKGAAGRVLAVCGSETMPGAAILCVRAAQRAGAGLVTLACLARNLTELVPLAAPEAILSDLVDSRDLEAGRLPAPLLDASFHASVVGCGLGMSGRTRTLVDLLLEHFEGPLVLDADGLNVVVDRIDALHAYRGSLVVPPHPGEAARLLGRNIPSDRDGRVACAKEISERSGAICVLKGHESIVTDSERHFVNPSGNAGMATAGAGDVLAGMLGAYLAWNEASDARRDALDVVRSGVHLHGLAGDLAARAKGMRGVIASDLIDFLPAAQLSLLRDEGA